MKPKPPAVNEMRGEYHFDYSKAVRGKYYKRILKEGSNVVLLDADVARAFPSSRAVNLALRKLIKRQGSLMARTRSKSDRTR